MQTVLHSKQEAVTSAPVDRPHIPLSRYILKARLSVVATAPLLYLCLLPLVLLDLFISIYQAVCFPIYGIPRVPRRPFLIFDRGTLKYLNLLERLNCFYCSYSNGLIAYVREIAGRTEQYWCPIKHERDPEHSHSRYPRFLPYGDPHAYRQHADATRRDFEDLRSPNTGG